MKKNRDYVLSARNFYGVLHVRDDPDAPGETGKRVLIHGTINHGTQLLGPGTDRIPTSYFGSGSGISRAIHALGDAGPIRIGILGLGAGVTAALARPGDTLHYYEINPLVVEIANREFGFFRACPADKQLFMGDGRLTLERMPDERLDFLAMDAFTSDAVPVHLLTREAYATYARHLNPGGVLAINISNRYLNLEPVVAQAAADLGWTGVAVADDGDEKDYYSPSTWVLVSRSAKIFEQQEFSGRFSGAYPDQAGFSPLDRRLQQHPANLKMTVYAVTIFLSAFLLFQVQPLIAKIILPWFGGSAAVWAAAMLFFQLLLLAGYAYAHTVIRFLRPKAQMAVHAALLAGSCLLLPILPSPSWKPSEAGDPTLRILLLLGSHHRTALFSAVVHQPAAASLVRAPVRQLDCRIDYSRCRISGRCWR